MKYLLSILIFLLINSLTWGQADTVFIRYNKVKLEEKLNYKIDTVIFDTPNARQILYGTTVLPWTLNQQVVKNYGLYLDSVSITTCKQERGKMPGLKNYIVNVDQTLDHMAIEIKYWGNCCHSFLCDLEVKNDHNLNLIILGYGATYCSCDCCFGLTYQLTKMEVEDFKNLKYVTINSDEKTKIQLKGK